MLPEKFHHKVVVSAILGQACQRHAVTQAHRTKWDRSDQELSHKMVVERDLYLDTCLYYAPSEFPASQVVLTIWSSGVPEQ